MPILSSTSPLTQGSLLGWPSLKRSSLGGGTFRRKPYPWGRALALGLVPQPPLNRSPPQPGLGWLRRLSALLHAPPGMQLSRHSAPRGQPALEFSLGFLGLFFPVPCSPLSPCSDCLLQICREASLESLTWKSSNRDLSGWDLLPAPSAVSHSTHRA